MIEWQYSSSTMNLPNRAEIYHFLRPYTTTDTTLRRTVRSPITQEKKVEDGTKGIGKTRRFALQAASGRNTGKHSKPIIVHDFSRV